MSEQNDKITSINPATLDVLGAVSNMSETQIKDVVQSARSVQPMWQEMGFEKRAEYILKARDILLEEIDPVTALISKENGKPLVEALGQDIIPVLDLMTYFAKKSKKILRDKKLCLGKWNFVGRRSFLEYYPYGVVGVIAPWNFPLSIPLGEVVMALMAGNTVVCKPSEFTPFVGKKIEEIFEKAGLPQDVFSLVTGDGLTGAALVSSGCDKIVFTGSVATGKKIMAACSQSLTPITLELGGKDPFIVFEDADVDRASSAAVWGAFCNSGQVCASVERVYVQENIYDNFVSLVIEKTKLLRQGDGLSTNSDIGAMSSEMQIKKVQAQVVEAVQKGAKVLFGGDYQEGLKGYFYQPTVLVDVDHSFAIVNDETFGPVMPIMKFSSEAEVVHLANDSEYGLNAYVWGKNKARNKRVASQLIAGTVNINETVFTHALPQTPWGGPKQSGVGRTHGEVGLLDLVQIRHVHENKCVYKKKYFWWYGYGPEKFSLLKNLALSLYGKGFTRAKAAVKYLVGMFRVDVN